MKILIFILLVISFSYGYKDAYGIEYDSFTECFSEYFSSQDITTFISTGIVSFFPLVVTLLLIVVIMVIGKGIKISSNTFRKRDEKNSNLYTKRMRGR